MQIKSFDFVLEAVQPIAHASESFGNCSIIMRRKVRQPGGSWAFVPCITADTMRHGMREAATISLLDTAGLLDKPNFSEAALRLLFAGGMITGASGGSLKLGEYRRMIDLLPTIALFGGCVQNRMIPGRLCVEDAQLLCKESLHLLPKWVVEFTEQEATGSCREHVEEVVRVRMDPTLDPNKSRMLTEGEASKLMQRLLISEKASREKDHVASEKSKSSLMPRRFERVCQGSRFFWSVSATCYSDLDVDTFMVACAAFLHDVRVGGKRGTGHGKLQAIAARNVQVIRPARRVDTLDPDTLGPRIGQIFEEHVRSRSEGIREFLEEVVA